MGFSPGGDVVRGSSGRCVALAAAAADYPCILLIVYLSPARFRFSRLRGDIPASHFKPQTPPATPPPPILPP